MMSSQPRIRVTTEEDGIGLHLPVVEDVSKPSTTPSIQTKATSSVQTRSVRTPTTQSSSSPQDSKASSRSRRHKSKNDQEHHHSDSQEESSSSDAAPTPPTSPLGIIIETKTAEQAVAVPAVVIHETTVASSSPKKHKTHTHRPSSRSRSTTPRRKKHSSAAAASMSKSPPPSSAPGRLLNVDSYSVVDVASVPNDLGVEAENSVSLREANSIFVVGRHSKHHRKEESSVAVSSRSPPNVPQEIIPLDLDDQVSTMSGNPYRSGSILSTAGQGNQRLSPTRLLRNYLSGNKQGQQHQLKLKSQQSPPRGGGMFPNDDNDVELGFPNNVPMEVMMLSPGKFERDLKPMPHPSLNNNNNKSMVEPKRSVCETRCCRIETNLELFFVVIIVACIIILVGLIVLVLTKHL